MKCMQKWPLSEGQVAEMDFEVSVRNTFEANDYDDAVRQMVEWLQEAASTTAYIVKNMETGNESFVDAEKIGYRG